MHIKTDTLHLKFYLFTVHLKSSCIPQVALVMDIGNSSLAQLFTHEYYIGHKFHIPLRLPQSQLIPGPSAALSTSTINTCAHRVPAPGTNKLPALGLPSPSHLWPPQSSMTNKPHTRSF